MSTACGDATDSFSESLNFPPKSSKQDNIQSILDTQVVTGKKVNENRLIRSPIESSDHPASSPTSKPVDPDPRSSSSYSMEFEADEEERNEVGNIFDRSDTDQWYPIPSMFKYTKTLNQRSAK